MKVMDIVKPSEERGMTRAPSAGGPVPPRRTVRPGWYRRFLPVVAIPFGLTLVLALIYSWNSPRLEYMTQRVDRGDIESTVTTTGNVNAVITVQVGSQVSGNIKALYADFNTKVKKGQLVALIDPAPFQAAVDQAHATVNNARAAVLTAQATVAKSQSDLASALANVASKTQILEKRRAPQILPKWKWTEDSF